MGLFRRGTKLLKFGSGLRDCCCRPEKPPEECWCPDWCRYYWEWDAQFFSAGKDERDFCSDISQYTQEYSHPVVGLAVGAETVSSRAVVVSYRGLPPLGDIYGDTYIDPGVDLQSTGGVGVSFFSSIYAQNLTEEVLLATFGNDTKRKPDSATQTQEINFWIGCGVGGDGRVAIRWFAKRYSTVFVARPSGNVFGPSEIKELAFFTEQTSGTLESKCETNSDFWCDGVPQQTAAHILGDVEISFDESTISVNGTSHQWALVRDRFGTPPAGMKAYGYADSVTSLWRSSGGFPLEGTVRLAQRDSCQPGLPCDCNTSIIGRRVLFEGREFTVGDLDTILGTSIEHDGQSYWEEVSAGSFRRTDYETCGDGSYVRRVKQATVSCSDFDGVERWYVILDHTCYDRDQESCLPSFTATRDRSWAGYFSCTATGKPLGMPKGENGIGDPDLYYDFTNGVLEHGCVGEQGCCGFGDSGVPFISFPNPDF